MNVNQEIESLVQSLPTINENRQYWLVRTESGSFFDTFVANGFIAIGYEDIPYSEIDELKRASAGDDLKFNRDLKNRVHQEYPEESKPGLISGQIYKFIYGIKKDDIVMIPSESSQFIAFGVVMETPIYLANDSEIARTSCDYTFRKKIKWILNTPRTKLDPYLYKALFAHQAINSLNEYSEEIERSIHNFFIKGEDAHIVLEVGTENDIHAIDLFNLGSKYLELLTSVSSKFHLGIDVKEIEVKMTLNSPGKIHFKASWKTIVVFGLVIIAINGGGLKFGGESWNFDLSTDGAIKNITDYLNQRHDREVQDRVMNEYTDSLQIQMPNDLINVLKQASTNKVEGPNPDNNIENNNTKN